MFEAQEGLQRIIVDGSAVENGSPVMIALVLEKGPARGPEPLEAVGLGEPLTLTMSVEVRDLISFKA